MLKNHKLAKSIADASFSEFHRQLTYKAKWNGGQVIEADRFFPSSKTCSRCGTKKAELRLSERVFQRKRTYSDDANLLSNSNLRESLKTFSQYEALLLYFLIAVLRLLFDAILWAR